MAISNIYERLTGAKPRQTGPGRYRAKAIWRNGNGYNVALDDNKCLWHDFVTGEGGRSLDLVVRVRGGSRAEALRWLSDFTGAPLLYAVRSNAERTRHAERRRLIKRKVPIATFWRNVASLLVEELLVELKAALSGRGLLPEPGEIYRVENLAAKLRRADGDQLVTEYEWWLRRYPDLTRAMVYVGRIREEAARRALLRYLRESNG